MEVRFYNAIKDIGQTLWNSLCGTDYPFIRYEFLHALETAGDDSLSVSPACTKETGWQPYHAIVFDGDKAVAAAPLYIKYHSYGEYIFDWSWSEAYERNGLNYFPKLLGAIPYSPVSGSRIAIAETDLDNSDAIYQSLIKACIDHWDHG